MIRSLELLPAKKGGGSIPGMLLARSGVIISKCMCRLDLDPLHVIWEFLWQL